MFSEAGWVTTQTARQIGADLKKSGVPIGNVFTSRLHRAVETGKLISGREDAGRTSPLFLFLSLSFSRI
jgi:bisphosphoglycerate-dependent phosphoglycerate mutase